MSLILLQAGVFLFAVLFTGSLRYWALKRKVLALPKPHSAHRVPTPVGGGLALLIPFVAVSSYAWWVGLMAGSTYLALYGAILVALAGLLDDLRELPVLVRLTLQFLAAGWTLFWLDEVAPINLMGWQLNQPWILTMLALFALVWLLNLYNFMDGTDGLAATELVFVTLAVLLLSLNADASLEVLMAATLMSSGVGFLVWNWAPAKVFMGDVGSGFCGFMLGLLALLSMQSGVMTLWTWLILLGLFVSDTMLTLFRRSFRGQRWYEGHSSHAYQHLARRFNSHSKVAMILIVVNCMWLAPLAWWSTQWQDGGLIICTIALLPLAFSAYLIGAGTEASQSEMAAP